MAYYERIGFYVLTKQSEILLLAYYDENLA